MAQYRAKCLAVESVTPYHPGTSLLHVRSITHVPKDTSGLSSHVGGMGTFPEATEATASRMTWRLTHDDVEGVVALLGSLAGCWEDAAAEVKERPEQADGVVWVCLRDAAECMATCVTLLGS